MNIERIKANTITDDNGCWVWTKSCSSSGYGQLTENKIYWTTHTYAYTCTHGAIPDGQVVRHTCHNRKCCNPAHLKLGTYKENWEDSKTVHLNAAIKKRKQWTVGNQTYKTCREVVVNTGISMNTVIKYTHDGVFNITAYREACAIAGWVPKV